MAAKGVVAFFIVVIFSLSISTLAGLGFYAEMGVDYSNSSSDDVQAAADAMIGQEASDQSGGSVLQDFTTSAGRTLATGWQVIANLDGILILLTGMPKPLADMLRLFFQLVFSITFAAFIRGIVLQ